MTITYRLCLVVIGGKFNFGIDFFRFVIRSLSKNDAIEKLFSLIEKLCHTICLQTH